MKLPKIQKIQGLDPNGIYWVTVGDKDHEATNEDIEIIKGLLERTDNKIKWIVAPHQIKLSNKNGNRCRKNTKRTQKQKN